MSSKSIDEKLNSLFRDNVLENQDGLNQPLKDHRIFVNRNIKLSRIRTIGFDLDYTLAQYHQANLDKLTMRLTLNTLVNENNYPDSILEIKYDPAFTIRGLVMDIELGNVLKMDKFRYVSLAYHGLKPLDSDTRAELYNNGRISISSERYQPVDTLFEILEAYLYAALVDHLENMGEPLDYQTLYKHLRSAIDLCHRDGSLKAEIMAHPKQYILDDPQLIPVLHMLKESGRKLFVLTNSEPEYTKFMMDYLFRMSTPYFGSWRECFEIVACHACKPKFFLEGALEMTMIDDKECVFFSGGNIEHLESYLKSKGDQVLYIGDHIYGDILKSKSTSSWRTCIIVPELSAQVDAENEARPFLQLLLKNESRRKEISMELNSRRGRTFELQQFKESEADELEPEHLSSIDEQIAHLNRLLEANHKELSHILYESRMLRRKISNFFNPYWGRLFKTGGQLSIFAEQIRDHACIYTSKVSNFQYYNTQAYMEGHVSPMPHEDNLYSVNDLNFDASMYGDAKSSDFEAFHEVQSLF